MWLLVMFLYTSLLTNYLLKPLWFSYTYKTGIFIKKFLKVTKRVETSFREGMQSKVLCVILTEHILYSNIPIALSIQLPVLEQMLLFSLFLLYFSFSFFFSLSPLTSFHPSVHYLFSKAYLIYHQPFPLSPISWLW